MERYLSRQTERSVSTWAAAAIVSASAASKHAARRCPHWPWWCSYANRSHIRTKLLLIQLPLMQLEQVIGCNMLHYGPHWVFEIIISLWKIIYINSHSGFSSLWSHFVQFGIRLCLSLGRCRSLYSVISCRDTTFQYKEKEIGWVFLE